MASNERLRVGNSVKPPLMAPTCDCAQNVHAEQAPETTLRTTSGGPSTRIPATLPSRKAANSEAVGGRANIGSNNAMGTKISHPPWTGSLDRRLRKTSPETLAVARKIAVSASVRVRTGW